MSRRWKGILVATICGAASLAAAAPQNLELFARRPQMHGLSISPDGRYVAFLSGAGDDTVLMTFDRTQPGSAFKRVTVSERDRFDIGWCRWASDQRVVCGLFGNVRGKKYAERPYERLFAVNADGTAIKTLVETPDYANPLAATTSLRNFSTSYGTELVHGDKSTFTLQSQNNLSASVVQNYRPERQDEVIDFAPGDRDSILIETDDDHDGYPSVVMVNTVTAIRVVKVPQHPPIQEYITDGEGYPRVGWGFSRSGEPGYFVRRDDEGDWRALAAAGGDKHRLRPIAIGVEPDTAYALGPNEGRDALWLLDLKDRSPPKLLFTHPVVDVGEPILRSDHHLLGVRYDVERPYVWYADPKHRALVDRLEGQYPGRAFDIIDSSEGQKVLVLEATSDVDFGTYYLYDTEKEKLQKLGSAYPELDAKTLGTMTNIHYTATDGTDIPGYLTVPTGAERKNLPLVVMPHDGPAARDSRQFSYLRTFLANRGYAVLQMNYRGSAGFGDAWRSDSGRDLGGIAYSDIQDATRWAVSQGIADPKRVCILGWGFGGYEALLSATRDSATYKCAISVGGIADLAMQRYLTKDAGGDKAKTQADSPLKNASRIEIPVLLIHGTKDWQVQMDHTQEMKNALEKARKDVTVVMIKNGTHDLDRQSDRTTLLKDVQTFLQQHLGPGGAP
jgi:dipeptidyl aminopeptidase/acylaminoacyl peptidase